MIKLNLNLYRALCDINETPYGVIHFCRIKHKYKTIRTSPYGDIIIDVFTYIPYDVYKSMHTMFTRKSII